MNGDSIFNYIQTVLTRGTVPTISLGTYITFCLCIDFRRRTNGAPYTRASCRSIFPRGALYAFCTTRTYSTPVQIYFKTGTRLGFKTDRTGVTFLIIIYLCCGTWSTNLVAVQVGPWYICRRTKFTR